MKKIMLLMMLVVLISYAYAQEEPPEDILLYPNSYQPTVVSSYDLETPSAIGQGSLYPVYISLRGIKTNPSIEIPRIDRISVSLDQAGNKFANAPRHLAPKSNSYSMDNMGYLIVYLKKDALKKEENIPNSIDLNLKATIYYRVNNGFGVFPQDILLDEINEQDFQSQKSKYNFWNNRGYLRLEKLQDGTATISVYDAAGGKITTLPSLGIGQTSNQFYLRRLFFESEQELKFRDKARIKFDKIVSGEKAANLQVYINNRLEFIQRFERQQLYPGSAWRIKSISSTQGKNEVVIENTETREVITLYKNQKNFDCRQIDNKDDCESITQCTWLGNNCANKNEQTSTSPTSSISSSSTTSTKVDENSAIIKNEFNSLKSKHLLLENEIFRASDEDLNSKEAILTKKIQDLESGYFDFMKKYSGTAWFTLARLRLLNSFPTYKSVWAMYDRLEDATGNKEKFQNLKNDLMSRDTGFHKDVYIPSNVNNIEKNSKGYYEDAITDYENVVNSYPDAKDDQGNELGPLAQKRIAEIYQNNLNDIEKAIEAYKKLLNQFSSTNYVESQKELIQKWIELLENRANFDINIEHILENGNSIDILLNDVTNVGEPSKATIDVNGNIRDNYKLGGNLDSPLNDWVIDEINSNNIVLLKRTDQRDIRQTIKVDQLTPIDNSKINLLRTDTKSQILVTILPGEERTFSVTKFTVHIPIEKRAFKLTPEQIESELAATNNVINSLENVIDKVGKLNNVFTGYCIAYASYLYVKNFFTDKTTVKARKEVINNWKEYCKKLSDSYSSVQRCINENADEIESEVAKGKEIITEIENDESFKDTPYLKDAEIKKRLLDYEISQNKDSGLIKEYAKNFLTTEFNAKQQDKVNFEVGDIKSYIFDDKDKIRETVDLNKLKEKYPELADLYKNDLSIIQDPNRKSFEKEKAAGEILEKEKLRRSYLYKQEFESSKDNYLKYDIDNSFNDVFKSTAPPKDNNQEQISYQNIIPDKSGSAVYIRDQDPNRAENIYLDQEKKNPVKYSDIDKTNTNKVYYLESGEKVSVIEILKSGSFQPKFTISDETGSKGRIKSISIDASHYIEVTKRDIAGQIVKVSIFESRNENELDTGQRIYDEFDFKDCNNKIKENQIKSKIGNSDPCNILRDADSKVNSRINTGVSNDQPLSIGSKFYAFEKYSQLSSNLDCTDINSVNECRQLFGACDPVMCPNSRFDFNGKWKRVDNVIASGISGSIMLGLHNYDIPYEPLPVCVTGVRAGLKNIQSIFKGYNDCLELKKRTGESIGGCSYIRSLGYCKVIWGEASSIIGTIGPERIFQFGASAIGQGGNEYVQNFHENIRRSNEFFNYFTNTYGQNVFAAYRGRGTKEIGSEFCETAIFGRLPGQGSLVDQLLKPSVPAQFFAIFDESPYVAIDGEEKSTYRILYHVYAGEDHDIRYLISLRDDKGQERQITYSTFLEKGNTNQKTVNVVEDSGFNQICVRIDGGAPNCGFGKVSSEFAIRYAQEKLVEKEYDREATNENECISSKSRLIDNPEIVTTSLSLIASGVKETGVKRSCSPENPGKGTPNEKSWLEKGTCGKDSQGRDLGKCWLDANSVNFNDQTNINKLNDDIKKRLAELKQPDEVLIELKSSNEEKDGLDNALTLFKQKIGKTDKTVLKSNLESLEKLYLELAGKYNALNSQTIEPDISGNIYFKLGELYQTLGDLKSTLENLDKLTIIKTPITKSKCQYDSTSKEYICTNVVDNEFVNLPGSQVSIKVKFNPIKSGDRIVTKGLDLEFYNPKRFYCDQFLGYIGISRNLLLNDRSVEEGFCDNLVSVKYIAANDEFTLVSFNVKLLKEGIKISPLVTEQGIPSQKAIAAIKKYSTAINTAANTYNIDNSLIAAIITQESQGNEKAVSNCGAAGIAQFMNDTAKEYGLFVPLYETETRICNGKEKAVTACNSYNKNSCDLNKDERFNPELSINAMAKYLQYLKTNALTSGRDDYIVAAYNGGFGALSDSTNCPGQKSFECVKNSRYGETRKYVPLVLAYKLYYDNHPEIFQEQLIASGQNNPDLIIDLPPEIPGPDEI